MSTIPVIFCGTPAFAVLSLRTLLEDPAFRVTAVVTQPDKPRGREKILTPPPVKEEALRAGLPVFQPEKPNAQLAAMLEEAGIGQPDFLAVVAYGALLSDALLAIPRVAPVNVHASLLPRWRGASPIEHAILSGDSVTGVTVQRMVKALDAGPILSLEEVPLDPRETARSLTEKLAPVGARLLAETLKQPLTEREQPTDGITVCGKLDRDDAFADPSALTATELDRRVRALNPRPGVVLTLDGQELKILESSLEALPDSAPLPCKDGTTLHLVTVQPAGKTAMPGAAWARGKK